MIRSTNQTEFVINTIQSRIRFQLKNSKSTFSIFNANCIINVFITEKKFLVNLSPKFIKYSNWKFKTRCFNQTEWSQIERIPHRPKHKKVPLNLHHDAPIASDLCQQTRPFGLFPWKVHQRSWLLQPHEMHLPKWPQCKPPALIKDQPALASANLAIQRGGQFPVGQPSATKKGVIFLWFYLLFQAWIAIKPFGKK